MHNLIKNKLVDYINILFILSIWFCIDTNFENIILFKNDISIKNFFLSLRSLSPFIFLIILFFASYFYKLKISFFTKNKTLNLIFIILYINFFVQIFGLLTTKNSISNSYYLLVSLLSIISVVNLYNRDLHRINYFISVILLSVVVTVLGYLSYEWFLTTRNVNMYGTWPDVFSPVADFSSNVIRSSGVSRSTMIIIIPLFYIILIGKTKLFYLIPYLILSSMIYFCQSRVVVSFFILFSFFTIFYFLKNETIKYRMKKLFLLIILPILFLNSLTFIKEEFHSKYYTSKSISFFNHIYDNYVATDHHELNIYELHGKRFAVPHEHKNYLNIDIRDSVDKPIFRKIASVEKNSLKDAVATQRYSFWKEIILKSSKPIIGYGVLGDRYLINENSSNTLIYSYASGGIISTVLMLIIIIRYTYLCLFLTFIKKIPLQKKNITVFSSIFTISFLLYRGIAENGIAVFSIDLLVFLSCIAVCERFKIQK